MTSEATSQTVAFIGLGTMGAPMAGHLAAAGHRVTVYNRSAQKAAVWVQKYGGQAAPTPRAAAAAQGGADFVFACVGNDDDLRAVVCGDDGAYAGMKAGAVFVDHTTTSAGVARELHALALAHGLDFIDAPVSGGQVGAEKGQLTVMCGGDAATFASAQPLMAAYGRAVTHLGDVGAGQLCKMVNQICVNGLLQALAEGIAFGQRAGLDMPRVLAVIGQGAAHSTQMEQRGPKMIDDACEGYGFAVDWMRKDLALVLDEARRNGARLPVTALVDQFYADVQQQAAGGRADISSLIRRLRG